MNIASRLKKKIKNWNNDWKFIRRPNEISISIYDQLKKVENYNIEDFIIFNVIDNENWFGLHIYGIYYCSNELIFINYSDILDSKIILDFSLENISESKNNASLLYIYTESQNYELKCSVDGSIYLIHRLINYGIQLNKYRFLE